MVETDELRGLWRRSLIVHADGRRDVATSVVWLQGPSLFADLRWPADRPSFEGVRCLRDISLPQAQWLARQEGFAGRLGRDGEAFLWQRMLDFCPPSTLPDAGFLRWEGETMIEVGRDVPYIEHWHQDDGLAQPSGALRMGSAGLQSILLRSGAHFMFARVREAALPLGATLPALVANAASLAAAQDLVNCEISFGEVEPGAWTISRSSLPWREGKALDLRCDGAKCSTADITPEGQSMPREWTVLEREGDEAVFSELHGG